MRAHCEGVAVLWCVVSAKGKVTGVQVIKALGDGFDENAMKTVRKWRFKPAMLNGKPVPAKTLVEVHFGTLRKAQKQGNSSK
jgi:periplasmic protein TonB